MERTAGAREVAREKAGDALSKAAVARDSAVSSLDKGIDSAVPVMQQGVASAGDKVDSARDMIVDDVLPKLQELLGNVQAQKDEVLAKPEGAVAVATGAPKKEGKKGGFLIALGVLAAIGAGVCYYLSQQKNTVEDDDTDPWAGTTDDGSGAQTGAAAVSADNDGATATSAPGADGHDVDTSDRGDHNHADTSGSDSELGAAAASDSEGDAKEFDGTESDPEELPQMVDVDDVAAPEAEGQAGFGTDFGEDDEVAAGDDNQSSEGKHRA